MPSSASIGELAADLGRLGIVSGDLVMVHASMRKIGPVEGGAAGLVEALERAVGHDGTLLVNLGALDPLSWVNSRPEAERRRLLEGSPPFNSLTTPADPDVGALAETFRQLPGTVVSDHPEGRFGARGRLAADLLTGIPWDDYYGPGSPLERLVERRGRILRLGADEGSVTALHYAEYKSAVPNKRRVRRLRMVAGPAAPEIRAVECLDDSDGIVDYPGEDYFVTILGSYLELGRARRGRVGRAPSELIEASDIVDYGVAWMNEHLTALGAGRAPREQA